MTLHLRTNAVWLCMCLSVFFTPLLVSCKSSFQPFTASCKADDEVDSKEREAVNQVALKFVQDALGPDPSAAYTAFSADAKGTVSLEQFVSLFQNRIKPMGPFNTLQATHTYIAKVTGGSREQRVICGNLSNPQTWVAVNTKPGPAEAHVVVKGQTQNNAMVFVVWLIPERGDWNVQYIHSTTAEMVGKSADDLQKMAESENQKQHSFNAFILYAAALQLADRGPFFQLGIRPEIEKRLAEVPRPNILQGQPPFTWNFGESSFKVLNVGPIGVSGKVYLLVDHEVEPWKESKQVERKNRDLITAFAKAYAQYKDAFAGLVIRAHERGGNRGYGTVEENKK
ncbi:MAG TPA: hypothetical protein VE263_16435 [Candidatus Angelobacter sp.]|nr:hypothetical protein [Candidatus Angelobacter sp.]